MLKSFKRFYSYFFAPCLGFGLSLGLSMGFGLCVWTLPVQPALACLSCGCGGTGSSADLGAIGGAASLFSGSSKWLIQSGVSFRQYTGSFNERGQWSPMPEESLMQGYQALLGVLYFPTPESSIGLQLPLQGNFLSGAAWGAFGSVAPTDRSGVFGAGLSDLQFQGSYKFLEYENAALAAWGNLSLPTGQVNPSLPEWTTGAGLATASAGLLGLYKPNFDWEFFLNLGYSRALGEPATTLSPFFVGQSLLYQLQANFQFLPRWHLGLGLNGQWGAWSAGSSGFQPAAKLKLVPSLQYEFDRYQGVRMAVGVDLPLAGYNAQTDYALYLIYYQFIE
jgi:hypothetical protein